MVLSVADVSAELIIGTLLDITDGRGLSNKVHHELMPKKSKVILCHKKAFIQLYITKKTVRFSFKSGCTVRLVKLMKEDWPIVFSVNFGSKQLLKRFITEVLEYKTEELTMCSLVMNLCSRDVIKYYYNTLNSSRLTVV